MDGEDGTQVALEGVCRAEEDGENPEGGNRFSLVGISRQMT